MLQNIKHALTHRWRNLILFLAVLGPGLITAFADNDAGGVATYSVAASKFGYSILTILIPVTFVLALTQEIGARIAIVTNKGLGDLVRERFGVRVSVGIFSLLVFVNFAVILQDIGGLKDGLVLFGLNPYIFLPLTLAGLYFLIVKSTYKRIERIFLFLILFYVAYVVSAIQAKPDWSLVGKSLFIPTGNINPDYFFTSIAVLGTTITAWGQFFVHSYIIDKHLSPSDLKYERLEVYIGAILTNVFSLFMMVAVAATLFAHRIPITGAAEAAFAIKPFAGNLASIMFGAGLLVAGLLGCAIVPLSTAYAFSEFFGYEGSVSANIRQGKLFYQFFLLQIILGGVAVLFPQLSLFKITLYADFLNGIMLPIIFYYLYQFSNNPELMGKYVNSKLQNILLIGSGVVITIAALIGGIGKIFGM